MTIEVKQIGKFDDRDNRSDYGEYTMLPLSFRSYTLKTNTNGLYKTGLEDDDKKRKQLESVLGEDLLPNSKFWAKYRLNFRLPTGSMQLNLDNPQHELFYLVATANHMLAPDRDTLLEDYTFKSKTIFYVKDKAKEDKKIAELQELKDEASKLVYDARNNKDKMLFLSYYLNIFATPAFEASSLYKSLSKYRDGLKTKQQIQKFVDAYKIPNEELQASYYVKHGLKHSLIVYDTNVNKYKFQEKHIGKNETEALIYFKDKKNEAELAALINAVKEKEA